VVPILFGELFTAIVYDGVLVDPGSPRMRRSLARHLRRLPSGAIQCVVATHHHEETRWQLDWAARRLGVPLYLSAATARLLQSPGRLPWVRAAIIGQPDRLEPGFRNPGPAPEDRPWRARSAAHSGHCDDHIVLYDRAERVLIAGDAFMGSYFATPNPDVDSLRWIDTLERLLALEIDVLSKDTAISTPCVPISPTSQRGISRGSAGSAREKTGVSEMAAPADRGWSPRRPG